MHFKTDGVIRQINSFEFNGGEIHVQAPRANFKANTAEIIARLDSSDEVMKLFMLTDAVRREYRPNHIRLKMHYVPYARQDRVCNPGEALSIRVFCDMINSLKFDAVEVLMPHSDVVGALLNNVVDVTYKFEDSVKELLDYESNIIVCSPDGGALKRTYKFAHNFGYDMITAEKVRDTLTGGISSTRVNAGNLQGKTVVIYDDLCDGGRTFIELASKLKVVHNADKVILVVAHGIFSKGLNVFEGLIDHVITSNSFPFKLHSSNSSVSISTIEIE